MRALDRFLQRVGLQRLSAPSVAPAPTPSVPVARRRVYHAAEASRLTADWITAILSADQEIRGSLRRLRGAARSLVRDTAHGARFVQLLQENVIGPRGVRLQARVSTVRGGQPNRRLNAQLESTWYDWCSPCHCSYDGRLSFPELEALAITNVMVDGEALFRIIRGADNPYSFAIQPLDADQLDLELGADAPIRLANGNQIRLGIEEDDAGRPVAYWIWSAHPSEFVRREHVRVPAEDMIHLYRTLRPGQRRGITAFAPVLLNQKMAAAFTEAAVVAARFGASKMALVHVDPEKMIDGGDPEDLGGNYVDEVSPGGVWRANPGETVSALDFQYPNMSYGEFMRAVLQDNAAGLGVAHASLTGDLRSVNYSSIRAGLLTERDAYRRLQYWLITHFHQRIYREWVRYAPLSGRIPARESEAYLDVRWQPRGWDWVDPLKDMQAAALAVKEGFTTRTAICAEKGEDFEENLDRLEEEEAMARERGLVLGSPTGMAPQAAASDPELDGEDPADAEDATDAEDGATDGATSDATSTDATRGQRLRVVTGARR